MSEDSEDHAVVRRWMIGAVRVTCVEELATAWIDPAWLLKTTRAATQRYAWLQPHFVAADGAISMNVQAFIIESGGKRIMVDPCIGNDKPRPTAPPFHMLRTSFLDRLTAAGFPPETIDIVLCTHLHADHCGWNTRLQDGQWVPTFPNARYLFSRDEVAFTQSEVTGDQKTTFDDSVTPIIEAGLADMIDVNHRVNDEVEIVPAPGHTPSHCYVLITSGGQAAAITGDALHHPFQAAEPEVCSVYCWNDEMAVASRRALLERCATDSIVMLGTHFAAPTAVLIEADGDGFKCKEALPG